MAVDAPLVTYKTKGKVSAARIKEVSDEWNSKYKGKEGQPIDLSSLLSNFNEE